RLSISIRERPEAARSIQVHDAHPLASHDQGDCKHGPILEEVSICTLESTVDVIGIAKCKQIFDQSRVVIGLLDIGSSPVACSHEVKAPGKVANTRQRDYSRMRLPERLGCSNTRPLGPRGGQKQKSSIGTQGIDQLVDDYLSLPRTAQVSLLVDADQGPQIRSRTA